MKSITLLWSLLALSSAALPSTNEAGEASYVCHLPECPAGPVLGCECINAGILRCWEASGRPFPKPVPQVCTPNNATSSPSQVATKEDHLSPPHVPLAPLFGYLWPGLPEIPPKVPSPPSKGWPWPVPGGKSSPALTTPPPVWSTPQSNGSTSTARPTPTSAKITRTHRPKPTASYKACGGLTLHVQGVTCPANQLCVDVPRGPDWCGMACDVPGLCVAPVRCAGSEGLACRSGQRCTNDPRSKCKVVSSGNAASVPGFEAAGEDDGASCYGVCIPDFGYSGTEQEPNKPISCIPLGKPGCPADMECVNKEAGFCASIDGGCLGTCVAVSGGGQ